MTVEENKKASRRGDGGTYLVIADNTPEFNTALRYAARIAQTRRGHVAILAMIELPGFSDWSVVEDAIKRELRDKCEASLKQTADDIFALTGLTPGLIISEQEPTKAVITAVKENPQIVAVILATSAGHSRPGPLIKHFTGKGLSKLSVPVFIVPGNLDEEAVDRIA